MNRTVQRVAIGCSFLAGLAAAGCSRSSAPASPTPSPAVQGRESTPPPAAPPAGGEVRGGSTPPPSGATAGAAGGPAVNLTGEHYTLNVALSRPPATPGESTLTVELRGANGFHVNERAPVGLDLEATNATTRAQWRATDATQRTQELAQFRVPVQVTAAGAAVHGTARAVVCRVGEEGVCEFVTREFAVALP